MPLATTNPAAASRAPLRLLRQAGRFEGFGRCSVTAMAGDLPVPNRDHPRHRRVTLDLAAPAPDRAAAEYDNVVTDDLDVLGIGAEFLPDVGYFSEIGTHPCVAGVAAALNLRPGQGKELDIGVIQLQQPFEIASCNRGEARIYDFYVLLRHRPRSISRVTTDAARRRLLGEAKLGLEAALLDQAIHGGGAAPIVILPAVRINSVRPVLRAARR